MVLAVVRSHYGTGAQHLKDREKVYRAGNALAEWLGLDSWVDIVTMQNPSNVDRLRKLLESA